MWCHFIFIAPYLQFCSRNKPRGYVFHIRLESVYTLRFSLLSVHFTSRPTGPFEEDERSCSRFDFSFFWNPRLFQAHVVLTELQRSTSCTAWSIKNFPLIRRTNRIPVSKLCLSFQSLHLGGVATCGGQPHHVWGKTSLSLSVIPGSKWSHFGQRVRARSGATGWMTRVA